MPSPAIAPAIASPMTKACGLPPGAGRRRSALATTTRSKGVPSGPPNGLPGPSLAHRDS